MKYHIITYGCQMNISDSERIAAAFDAQNYQQTDNINKADIIVVAMCSVRQSAVDRIHGLVEKFKQLKTKNHKLKTILTGCVLAKDKNKFKKSFDEIIDIKDIKDVVPKYSNKFSANVPIITGCNNFCAYCVVPYTRDREISRPAGEIIDEVKNLVKNDCKEIWLLGQNVNSYKDIPCTHDRSHKVVKFPELLKLINGIPGDFWIRFTSGHPKDFNEEVINAMATCKKVTPYLNLPVQSGDDRVLKSMNRRYTIAQYKNKIKKLREKIPNIALSTDVIIGFPGETKKQFLNTAKLFREIKFDMVYINKYSPRAGTAAAKLEDNIPPAEKKCREKILTKILKQTALEKNKKLIGKKTAVLINENRGNNYFGKNEHYKTIKIKSDKNLLGRLVKVKITEASPFILEGKITNE